MPTYRYRCSEGHEFELFRAVAARNDEAFCDEPLDDGGTCDEEATLMPPTGVQASVQGGTPRHYR